MKRTSSTGAVCRHIFTGVILTVFVLNRTFNPKPTERLQHCTSFAPTGLTRTEQTPQDPVIKKQNVFETSVHQITLRTAKTEEQQIGMMQLTQNEIKK